MAEDRKCEGEKRAVEEMAGRRKSLPSRCFLTFGLTLPKGAQPAAWLVRVQFPLRRSRQSEGLEGRCCGQTRESGTK